MTQIILQYGNQKTTEDKPELNVLFVPFEDGARVRDNMARAVLIIIS